MRNTTTTVLFLAAGLSVRFGSNKLLMQDANGEFLAIKTAKRYQHLPRKWAVIHEQQMALLIPLCQLGFQVTLTNTSRPLSSSLKHVLSKTLESDSWLVALADMPQVSSTTIDGLVALLKEGKELVVPRYRGQRGNPVGFGKSYVGTISDLIGDKGLREVLESNKDKIDWLDTEDPGILFDIDTPSDWQRFAEEALLLPVTPALG